MDGKTMDVVNGVGAALVMGLCWFVLGIAVGAVAGPVVVRRVRARRGRGPVATGAAWPPATVHRVERAERRGAGRPALVQPGDLVGGVYQPARPLPLVRDRSCAPVLLDVPTTRTTARVHRLPAAAPRAAR